MRRALAGPHITPRKPLQANNGYDLESVSHTIQFHLKC